MRTTRRYASRVLAAVGMLVVAAPVALAQGRAAPEPPRAARTIARGAVLTRADIALDAAMGADSSDTEATVAPGWIARRVISAGEPLRPPAVMPPPVVRAGDTVRVVRSDGAVTLSARGRATNAAAPGERVSVRLDDGRRIEGQAAPSGQVIIP
jgi:flagella basal body P-ring formation protein FlgA